jgi:hypothetical protein
MNNKFDELAKGLAQSVTRRQALKRFGAGLVGMALASFGLAPETSAAAKTCIPQGFGCSKSSQCCSKRCARFDPLGNPVPLPFCA